MLKSCVRWSSQLVYIQDNVDKRFVGSDVHVSTAKSYFIRESTRDTSPSPYNLEP